MTKTQLRKLKTFAAICKAAGKKESDYDVSQGKNAAEKAFICLNRLKLICKQFNGKEKPNMADTNQNKYYPWGWIESDDSRPFGFRLSFSDYDYDSARSDLGARPYLLDSDDVEHVFETFKAEYEEWQYWENMSFQED